MHGKGVSGGVDGTGEIVGGEMLVSSGLGTELGLGLLLFDLLASGRGARSSILACRCLICSCRLLMFMADDLKLSGAAFGPLLARGVRGLRGVIADCVELVGGVWTGATLLLIRAIVGSGVGD